MIEPLRMFTTEHFFTETSLKGIFPKSKTYNSLPDSYTDKLTKIVVNEKEDHVN